MNYHEQIDRYLSHEMSSEEKSEFERELSQNEVLRKHFTEHKETIQKLKNLERAYLKSRLQAIEADLKPDQAKKKLSKFYWLAIPFLLICIGYFIWTQRNKTVQSVYKPETNQSEIDSNVNFFKKEIIPQDSSVSPILKSKNKDSVPIKKSINSEQLFAAHFEPYTDDDIEYEVRSSREKSNYELFKHYYINNKYDKALAAFELLNDLEKSNEQILFIKANIFIATNKINEAQSIIFNLKENPQSAYTNEIYWYLGLCYIKQGELYKAKSTFNSIRGSFKTKANMILKEF